MIGDIIEVGGRKYKEVIDVQSGCEECAFNIEKWGDNCNAPEDNNNCLANQSHWEEV